MPIYQLDERIVFPPPSHADPSGVLCIGGDLRPERILLGYATGIFPWPHPGLPLLWHSPDPRFVLFPDELHVPRSLRKVLRRGELEVRLDTAFEEVIRGCARVPRPGQTGTWLIPEMVDAYMKLHELGFAHSFEAWRGEDLVGGLYGVSLGAFFCGESMYADVPDASKVAFVTLVEQLVAWGFHFVDCQVETPHLARFGGRDIPRAQYLSLLREALKVPTRRSRWTLEPVRSTAP